MGRAELRLGIHTCRGLALPRLVHALCNIPLSERMEQRDQTQDSTLKQLLDARVCVVLAAHTGLGQVESSRSGCRRAIEMVSSPMVC